MCGNFCIGFSNYFKNMEKENANFDVRLKKIDETRNCFLEEIMNLLLINIKRLVKLSIIWNTYLF